MIENWFPYNIGVVFNPNHKDYSDKCVKRCEEIKKSFNN